MGKRPPKRLPLSAFLLQELPEAQNTLSATVNNDASKKENPELQRLSLSGMAKPPRTPDGNGLEDMGGLRSSVAGFGSEKQKSNGHFGFNPPTEPRAMREQRFSQQLHTPKSKEYNVRLVVAPLGQTGRSEANTFEPELRTIVQKNPFAENNGQLDLPILSPSFQGINWHPQHLIHHIRATCASFPITVSLQQLPRSAHLLRIVLPRFIGKTLLALIPRRAPRPFLAVI
jgi:hypothetical protein